MFICENFIGYYMDLRNFKMKVYNLFFFINVSNILSFYLLSQKGCYGNKIIVFQVMVLVLFLYFFLKIIVSYEFD